MQNFDNCDITIFGDSIAKGLYIDNGQITKIKKGVVDYINEEFLISVNNQSSFGQTLKRVFDKNIFKEYVNKLDENKKNIAVISLGGNDADYDWQKVADNPDIAHDSKTPLKEFAKILKQVISYLTDNGVIVLVTSLFPISAERYYNAIINRKYDGQKILQYLSNDISNLNRNQEAFNMQIIKIAGQTHVRYLNFRTVFLQKHNFLDYVCNDGIHPNELGHKLIADILIKEIKRILN